MDGIKGLIRPYLTVDGGIGHNRSGHSGNAPMYTVEVMLLLRERGFVSLYGELENFIFRCQGERGQFFRTPEPRRYGHTSIDDLFAISSLNRFYAEDVFNFLRLNWGFYETTPNPNGLYGRNWWKFWGQIFLYRRLDFIAHLKYCMGKKPSSIEEMAWNISMNLTERDTADGWRIGYFKAKAKPGAWADYEARLKAVHGSLAELRGGYFQDYGHPAVILAKA